MSEPTTEEPSTPPGTQPGTEELGLALAQLLPAERVLTRTIDRIAFANDASVYRLVPRVVVLPTSVAEVRALLRFSRERRVPLTFRAAGTSLSGQAVTDGILAVLSRHWREIEVLDDGARVRVQPGAIGGVVNQHLLRHGAKIGPDPASIQSCMIGGILANNSSGMCCGIEQNAYRTLDELHFVLPDGTEVDTRRPDADAALAAAAPEIVAGLLELKAEIENDADLVATIRRKYSMKNTMGYSLNAFLDHERPVDILSHLMIGSEGTLGFLAEAVLRTVPDYPEKSTGLLFFDDVPSACAAIEPLAASGARALELMDRPSLAAIAAEPGVPKGIADLPAEAAAILVEYQCETVAELDERCEARDALLPRLPLASQPEFTRDPQRQAALWRVRKGLIPSVGAMRARGTSFIIEDVVFPVSRLAQGVTELQQLFRDFAYDDAILFGHAKDGNLHFVLTQSFQEAADVKRYDGFMRALVEIVALRHGGALKAEHGTGRNMAPFVRAEWGDAAYRAMQRIKTLIDPDGLLNPGVVINPDPTTHVQHLKDLPRVEEEVDACIECGFCERMCPSRDLTLTPRQRIVVRREMARLRASTPDSHELRELERDYRYMAIETCAADGMCALACPVRIDTGKLVKRLRHESHSAVAEEVALQAALRFGRLEGLARGGLRAGHGLGRITRSAVTGALSTAASLLSRGATPGWVEPMPRAAPALPSNASGEPSELDVVFWPTCVTRTIGTTGEENPSSTAAALRVLTRAGLSAGVPASAAGTCCGMPFASKGFRRAHRAALAATVDAMWQASNEGRLPVIVDSSPCAETLRNAGDDLDEPRRRRFERVTILDAVEYAHDTVLPRLSPTRRKASAVIHPACSVERAGLTSHLQGIVAACADHVETPISAGCCGFAGDRGFVRPELTASATRQEAAEVLAAEWDDHVSSSRTCEIGLERATGLPYRSFWFLLDDVSDEGDG